MKCFSSGFFYVAEKRELFFEIFVLLYAMLVNLMEIMDGMDDENTFLLDDELHSDTDISSNYLDYSSDDSCSELSSDEDLSSSFFSTPLGITLFYKKMEGESTNQIIYFNFPSHLEGKYILMIF
ncbi:uncharacterized protein NPIL_196351 [Nephila pilipes]|uniref:Uncharacterized protein n=1 Tax=Nephila pilipes TaxID=299642 RepID=A0A8X6T3C1_NEPPI|nr:uncharacterized protein NPIL_196351 [Nephila pilipes]